MPKRIFLSIDISPNLKEKIIQWQKTTSDLFESCPIKWTKSENLHLTLAFIGSANDTKQKQIEQICENVAKRAKKFKISTLGFEYMSADGQMPNLLWLKCHDSFELQTLHQAIIKELSASDIKTSSEQFTPHITIGKIIKWAFKSLDSETIPDIKEDFCHEFLANKINICESLLTARKTTYKIIASYNLQNLS